MTNPGTLLERLPWIHRIALAGLLLRIVLALVSANINHADEVMQYLEQGHRLAFGYGDVTWELRFGFRSYLGPLFIAGVLRTLEFLHLGNADVYVPAFKIFFSVLSVSLIYSVYSIGQSLFSEAAARAAAIFAAGWYELVYIASKPNPEIIGMYCLLFAVACLLSPRPAPRAIALGLACSFAVAIRIQYAPVAAVIGIVALFRWQRRDILRALAAAAVLVVCVGLVDYATVGTFLGSYRNSVAFEHEHHISGYWGVRPFYYYFGVLMVASGGLFLVALAAAAKHFRQAWVVIACATAVIGFHMAFAHKEYRYVFATIPVMCLLLGQATTWFPARWTRAAVAVPLLVSLIGLAYALPFESKAYREPVYKRSDVMRAYDALRRDPDLAGLWLPSIAGTDSPGYYHLHRNVPTYFYDQLGYRNIELDPQQTVTHILCPVDFPEVPGFHSIGRFGQLELRKQVTPAAVRAPLYPTGDLLDPRIDGVMKSAIDHYL
jgi:GPI mannosyltransferase 3